MRFSDIKVKNIYLVDFDPVKQCEFNGRHLAVVLKRNNDNRTFIVMPLTSSDNGVGINKINIRKIKSLPKSFSGNTSYAVYNQIRTVNASRFIALNNGKCIIKCMLENNIFYGLQYSGINDLILNLNIDEKIKILKKAYESESINKAISLAYNVLKFNKDNIYEKEKLLGIETEIKRIISKIPYSLNPTHINNGIKEIFDEILSD